mmetsp:Transcript_98752/g.318500  ORF Transcript_98752/g.318500 Transcript_98752/m.318500 type:complete len:254 (+) Transcript_98752:65-826(+)
MASLTLERYQWGLVVTGETFAARELLKSSGGKWDAPRKGWVFPAEGRSELVAALRASPQVKHVEDRALVRLTVQPCPQGSLVLGETFPVRELLRGLGGTWRKEFGGWVFPAEATAGLLAELALSPDVGDVQDSTGAAREAATPKSRPGRGEGGSSGAKEQARALVARGAAGQLQASPQAGRVVETEKRQRQVQQRADGSKVDTATQRKERKVSCKETGSVETHTVTKCRKVRETKDMVEETATITIKRVRRKT